MRKVIYAVFTVGVIFTACKQEKVHGLKSYNLEDVKLLDGPFYRARQVDIKYMMDLEPDRLLAPYLKDAGFEPLKNNYGNWENTGLDGHIGGHYLSALAFMYAATGKKELLDRINYMIDWLGKCQEKNGNGYVGGIPGAHAMWEEIREGKIDAGSFSLNHRWVPLYNIHKLFAGLRDVYLNTENTQSLNILVKLTDWFYDLTANLSDEQIQDMLRSEHGGLNEIFVDVAELTGNNKYLRLAERFSHKAILEPLLQHRNELTGLHANTQIPKVVGYKRYADATHNQEWADAAAFFWKTVIDDWTISIGGNSVREHFHPANDFSSMIESNQGPETCNTYNMLRLTKLLFLSDPQAKYIDYYERALFNHILSSEHPVKGGFVYFTPMRPRHYRVYSQPQLGFWCCVGSGLENPGRYGEMIYSHDSNNVFVNLFVASELTWKDKEVKLSQHTRFPYSESTRLEVVNSDKQKFVLNVRNPAWIKKGSLKVSVNNSEFKIPHNTGAYIPIKRTWNSGDVVDVSFIMDTYVEYLPDSSDWFSVLHGPIVLAAISDSNNLDGLWADDSRMGHVANGKFYPIDEAPMVVTDDKDLTKYIKPVPDKPLTFSMGEIIYQDKYKDLELKPFFDIHEARYIVYWPVFNSQELKTKLSEIEEEEKKMLAIQALTIDEVATGEQQPESDHHFQGEGTGAGVNKNRYWRNARGWFSYDMKDTGKESKFLQVTYWGKDSGNEFVLSINSIVLDTVKTDGSHGEEFYEVDYKIPNEVLTATGNGVFNIKFTAVNDKSTPGIYYVRLLKDK